MAVVLVIGGFILLYFGGDFLVRGAAAIAMRLQIPTALVGMTIVAIGTSAPELVVSVQAALGGNPDISVGNVVGSNIMNVALILGLTIFIFPFSPSKDLLRYDWVAMMAVTILFYLLVLDLTIGRVEGILLLALLVAYIAYRFLQARHRRKKNLYVAEETGFDRDGRRPILVLVGFVVGGSIALVYGAELFLDGAIGLAESFGLSDRIIGVTLVAFGTSIPELAASVAAALKKQKDILLGNIIGSNFFNIVSIIGVTALVSPISVSEQFVRSDFLWMLATSFIILPLAWIGRRFNRVDGLILMGAYTAYLYFLLQG